MVCTERLFLGHRPPYSKRPPLTFFLLILMRQVHMMRSYEAAVETKVSCCLASWWWLPYLSASLGETHSVRFSKGPSQIMWLIPMSTVLKAFPSLHPSSTNPCSIQSTWLKKCPLMVTLSRSNFFGHHISNPQCYFIMCQHSQEMCSRVL